MSDRRTGSPWGMIQAIAASLALAVSVSVGVYTRVITDVMAEVNIIASDEGLKREKIVRGAIDQLETSLLLKIEKVSGEMDGLDEAIQSIETDIALIKGQQIADAEVRKLVRQVSDTLIELKGDVKSLKEKSAEVSDIATQLNVLSAQVASIQERLVLK